MSTLFYPARLMSTEQVEWWQQADRAARAGLNAMQDLGWAGLCAPSAWGGAGQDTATLSCVLEAVAAVNVDTAALVYASNAAHVALQSASWGADQLGLLRDVTAECLAWPAFHDLDEQIWPALDAQGYLRGQVDMLMGGAQARWAVMPAQLSDQTLRMVLVDLAHPAVIRGAPLHVAGLRSAGIIDVEFGGVPCELVNADARAIFAVMSARLVPAVLALQCGLARATWQATRQHLSVRQQGGGPLLGWGEVRRLLSLMQERLQVMQGSWQASLHARSDADSLASYMTLHIGDLACALAEDAVQLFGGAACGSAHAQAQGLGDARQLKGLLGGVAWRR